MAHIVCSSCRNTALEGSRLRSCCSNLYAIPYSHLWEMYRRVRMVSLEDAPELEEVIRLLEAYEPSMDRVWDNEP